MKQRYWAPAAVIVLLGGFVFVNNTTLKTIELAGRPHVLAHRGMAQTFPADGVEADTCTAATINPPVHDHLENTIAGIRAAFVAGADQVELDVQWTADNQFAVFHDWTLECRTNGTGVTRDHTMDQLRNLDIGYGYSADGGATFPFRGKGIGLMPSLDETFAAFPSESLLIHIKSNDPAEGAALADHLIGENMDRLTVYGGEDPIAELHERRPDLRVMSKQTLLTCLSQYEAIGWTGAVPESCHHTQLHIPEGYAPWLWGWPELFTDRMNAANARVVLVAGSGGYSEGFDTPGAVKRIPAGFTGFVWTNRVETIAPLLR